jgi:hypothetical protein
MSYLIRRLKKLQKHLEKVEIWNPSVFRPDNQREFQCGAIANNHIK